MVHSRTVHILWESSGLFQSHAVPVDLSNVQPLYFRLCIIKLQQHIRFSKKENPIKSIKLNRLTVDDVHGRLRLWFAHIYMYILRIHIYIYICMVDCASGTATGTRTFIRKFFPDSGIYNFNCKRVVIFFIVRKFAPPVLLSVLFNFPESQTT